MTSSTITRSWLSAVVCSLSIASSAVLTAVSNPNVATVPDTSLSIVFGTPTMRTPISNNLCAIASEPSPPIAMNAWMPRLRALSINSALRSTSTMDAVGLPHGIRERVSPIRRAQDRAAQVLDSPDRFARQRNDVVLAKEPHVTALDAEHVPASIERRQHGGANDGVEAWGVAAPGADGDSHGWTRC